MRILELDGIRGVAILLVLVVHFANVPGLQDPFVSFVRLGWAGVDIFFVLSGYLITTILLRTKSDPDYFRNFYTNRTLRIFPLYYAFLAAASFFIIATPMQTFCYWLYLGNFLSAFGKSINGLTHLWSLAIEEQFYLLWPLVVWRSSARRLTWFCVAAIALIASIRFVVVHYPLPSPEFVYTLTPLRCDALLFGALIACLDQQALLRRFSSHIKWVAIAGFALFALGVFRARGTGYIEPGIERFGYLGVDLLCASFIASAALWRHTFWFAPFRSRTLIFFGKYSYGIYILHMPISRSLVLLRQPFEQPLWNALLFFAVGTALTVGAALISWHLIEKHFLALKKRIHSRRTLIFAS